MSDRLTDDEFLAIFGRPSDATRWMASVDSAEYLTLVAYLVNSARPQ
jgi:class 3 adenylate cyclase